MPQDTRIDIKGDASVTWNHPEIYGPDEGIQDPPPPSTLRLDLCHVRAAKGIIIRYSSRRDGWVISMEKTRGDAVAEGEEVEVAFVPGWAAHEE